MRRRNRRGFLNLARAVPILTVDDFDSADEDILSLLRQIERAGHISMEDIEELTND